MMHLKQQQYLVLGLVILLALVLMYLPHPWSARIKHSLTGLLSPLFGVSRSTQQLADQAVDAVQPRSVLLKELHELREENRKLRIQQHQWDSVRQENVNLRLALDWKKTQEPWNLKLARVIGRDPSSWWHTMHIDLGANDGVQLNLPVFSEQGEAVGKIIDVAARRSQVAFIGDANCELSAMVQETRESGFLRPSDSSVLDPRIATLQFLPSSSETEPGHRVVTNPIGNIFPPEILIGTVIDRRDVGGLYHEARVRLSMNLSQLERVWVKLP